MYPEMWGVGEAGILTSREKIIFKVFFSLARLPQKAAPYNNRHS
jgi:hypothetical protein